MKLPRGRYDRVVDQEVARALASGIKGEVEPIDPADVPHRLANHIAKAVRARLPGVEPEEQQALVADVIRLLGDPDRDLAGDGAQRLVAVTDDGQVAPVAPDIPLSEHDLLVNARGEPHLAAELKKELASADAIDLIVAFVRWTGIRLVVNELRDAIQRGARVRLLTTTYTGSTEQRALDELESMGVEVRVSYDTQTTRLHAKSWQFHRKSGFGTAYVGSSNLTKSALVDGREWNVRLSQDASPAVFGKLATAFEAQWESGDYEPYDAARFVAALHQSAPAALAADVDRISGLEIRPWPYQAEILDALAAERLVRRSTRNLVVAPTGTGKTVVAALDYRRLVEDQSRDLSLLFVAHREQILTQSRRTFREVMADGSFGELLVGGERPRDHRHVFASVQSLSTGSIEYDPRQFDVLIVDEFHHAEASTYQKLLDHFDPGWLLALTATPERSDGLDIRKWTDGRTAFDMRLWHALDRQLLAPFQYFGLADVADYSDVRWVAGAYNRTDLGGLYTGNDARTRQVLKAVEKVVGDPRDMRALGFCATVEHAHEMAEVFTARGWPAAALDGGTPYEVRREVIGQLERGELCAIFTRDVFNEGVDIPSVDTILLLRPTESVTVHLQQLGRGLRRHPSKDVCTVIDLVGQHRKEYRYDLRLRAMTGLPRRQLAKAAEEGFPYLPSGCHIELDRQAEQWVLDNIKQAVLSSKPALRKELLLQVSARPDRSVPPLAGFIEDAGIELEDVEKAGGWASLQRYSGMDLPGEGPEEPRMQRGVGRLTHVDDTTRIDTWLAWLRGAGPPVELNDQEASLAWMLLVTMWSTRNAPETLGEAWRGLWTAPAIRSELIEVLQIARDRIQRPTIPLPDLQIPLHLHATYGRDELLAGFGELAPGRTYSHREGVWFHEESKTELLFVTLEKTEGDYSPETMYRDYAISRDLFHWETQNRTSVDSPVGRRYLDQLTNGVRILLAVRAHKKDPWGRTAPYVLLGPARYVQHTGDKPIAITWRLQNPIPADLYEDFKVAAA